MKESLTFDFRAKSIKALLARLEELNAALNLRSNFYTARRNNFGSGQLSLLPEQANFVLLIIGAKCAGKTTFSDHMANYDSVGVFEASTVLRDIAAENGESLINSDGAFAFLQKKGMDIVARRIANYLDTSDTRWNIVTGLRTPEELLYLKERFVDCQIVAVDADPKTRFERHIRRARDQDLKTFSAFSAEDDKQKEFGALRVVNDIGDITIRNEGSIDQYKKKIDEVLEELTKVSSTAAPIRKARAFGELHRCLFALAQMDTRRPVKRFLARQPDLARR